MKFYNSAGANPRVVRIVMDEKQLAVETIQIDVATGENRREPYLSINPFGQCPALQLDDGQVITEITAICEYLDELQGPSLIGRNPSERAMTRMWIRRLDLNVFDPMVRGYQSSEGLGRFSARVHALPHAADDLKAIAQEGLSKIEGIIAGRSYLCGDRFSLADIMLFAFLDNHSRAGQPINQANQTIGRILDRVRQRPSSAA